MNATPETEIDSTGDNQDTEHFQTDIKEPQREEIATMLQNEEVHLMRPMEE
ncbi:hypothetical protein TRAPUB_12319 [Trametes pubescens]|uniref:Uncharacterized protein n=1 Tax=Trametes pubescens TaxID=154538 RepID=A0A1M2VU90_TRAPU|nr:hypothetical protein TRAPUB_12319 [Trametes pubescens]